MSLMTLKRAIKRLGVIPNSDDEAGLQKQLASLKRVGKKANKKGSPKKKTNIEKDNKESNNVRPNAKTRD